MDPNDYYYQDIVDGLSDPNDSDSSGYDEKEAEDRNKQQLEAFRKHLTPEQFEMLTESHCTAVGLRHQDDSNLARTFEQEMANEAKNHVNGVHVGRAVPRVNNTKGGDEEEKAKLINVGIRDAASTSTAIAVGSSRTKNEQDEEKQTELEELFYDPDEDDSNQRWMDSRYKCNASNNAIKIGEDEEQRRKRLVLETGRQMKKPRSDATLNCPCCLTLLCLDCQRHDLYRTQYRAMFVQNCRIDFQQKLIHKNKSKDKLLRRRSKNRSEENDDGGEKEMAKSNLYYPVHCAICNTQVAVYDLEEVYHFFSVIASH